MPKTPNLTDADVVNLLDCAGSGIGYWAESGHVDEAAKTYRVIERSDEIADGDLPVDKTLSYDELREAFTELAAKDMLPAWQMREIEEDDLAFDSTVGDMVVQWAMFGDLVYG